MTVIVFVSGLAADRGVRVGGLTLLERALIVARRAGMQRCLVAGGAPPPRRDPRLPRITPVADLEDARAVLRSEGASAATKVLCLHAAVVTTPSSLARFVAAAGAARVAGLRALPVAVAELAALDGLWAPMLAAEGGDVDEPGAPAPLFVHVPGAFFAWVRDARQTAEVERRLLRSLDNARDGRLDTLFNRRLSGPISRLLFHLPLKPNHVTVLSFLSALLAAWAFARGTYAASVLGAALFQLSTVLDCCDGEVARVKFLESRFGDLLDVTCDSVGNVAVFIGIAYGAWLAGELPDAAGLAVAMVGGLACTFPLVTWAERRLPTPAATPQHRLAQRLIALLTTRDFSAVVLLAAVTSTLPWFLRGAAVGVNVFWLVLLGLLVRGRRRRAAA